MNSRPTEPGYYWLRIDRIDRVTKKLERGIPEIRRVVLDRDPNNKTHDRSVPQVLWVFGTEWRIPLSETDEHYHWGKGPIPCDIEDGD